MRTIRFKSFPEVWRKEYLGLKRNTVRRFDDEKDLRLEILKRFIDGSLSMLNIEIEDTILHEYFTRKVTDVTKYEYFYIISW